MVQTKLTVSGAREPLSTEGFTHSWSKYGHRSDDEDFRISMDAAPTSGGKTRYYHLTMSTRDALVFALKVAERLSRCEDKREDYRGLFEQMTPAESLRRLADILESKRDPSPHVDFPYSVRDSLKKGK